MKLYGFNNLMNGLRTKGGIMNKRIVIGLIILILLIAAAAGCSENKAPKKSGGPSYEEVDGEYPSESGWLDDDGNQGLSAKIPLEINASEKITEISVKMKFEDSDSEHSESDDGSDPDDVSIKLSNGVMESEAKSGSTPCTLTVTMESNSTDENENEGTLMGNWEISINGNCNGGKPRLIFGLLVWIDQGVAYTLEVTYSYIDEIE